MIIGKEVKLDLGCQRSFMQNMFTIFSLTIYVYIYIYIYIIRIVTSKKCKKVYTKSLQDKCFF